MKWIKHKPSDFDDDDDPPLVDTGNAGAFFAHAANTVKAIKGEDAAWNDNAKLDVKSLWPSWETNVDALVQKEGLGWLV
jgi:hypothetical protein